MTRQIEVCIDPTDCPQLLNQHPEFWFGQELRKAGVPLFERSVAEGPHRGKLTRALLESGRVLFVWTDEERRFT